MYYQNNYKTNKNIHWVDLVLEWQFLSGQGTYLEDWPVIFKKKKGFVRFFYEIPILVRPPPKKKNVEPLKKNWILQNKINNINTYN